MAPKVFVTGATGYIGGDALYRLVQAHPDYDITCLVRNSDKGAQVASQYSRVRLVYGDLDSAELLEEEAQKADVILHCANADHEGAARTLGTGLTAHSQDKPGYLIHTSGTGILTFADLERNVFGEASSKIYDDWEGVGEITALPDHAPHRNVDKIILDIGTKDPSNVKTAIVCPPCIYGTGRGPGNQRSIQIPDLVKCTLETKVGIQVGEGKSYWNNVHVHDLSDCYLKLVEAAVDGGGKATWGKDGYYFTENGEHAWAEVAKAVATASHKQGFIPADDVVAMSGDDANQLRSYGALLWGSNSRGRALRARKLLGWSPKGNAIDDEIPETVKIEAKTLGLIQGHASKVSG